METRGPVVLRKPGQLETGLRPSFALHVVTTGSLIRGTRLRAAFDAEHHAASHQEVRRLGQNVKPSRRARTAASAQHQSSGILATGLEYELPGSRAGRSVVRDLVAEKQHTVRFDSDYART
jgi:hypothetical protein